MPDGASSDLRRALRHLETNEDHLKEYIIDAHWFLDVYVRFRDGYLLRLREVGQKGPTHVKVVADCVRELKMGIVSDYLNESPPDDTMHSWYVWATFHVFARATRKRAFFYKDPTDAERRERLLHGFALLIRYIVYQIGPNRPGKFTRELDMKRLPKPGHFQDIKGLAALQRLDHSLFDIDGTPVIPGEDFKFQGDEQTDDDSDEDNWTA